MWRNVPPPPPEGATVDVFITTYNEPIDMVLETAEAAQRIRFPHSTWILDDGDRHDLADAAAQRGIGYITRSSSWTPDKPRHAKAGNLNNALFETHGEFILVLDADQVPEPEILDKTLGYFREPHMALVQTPQYFHNVPFSDPLGSQAPLFYGPIQQGKDGWNAAYFCGSNAVLRREALMRLGIRGYVRAVEEGARRTLYAARKMIKTARKQPGADQPEVQEALESVLQAVRDARRQLREKRALADISVTEDMATCMRLHALGWRSAYHHEVLARGLAPDDVRTMLTQRLRWAQGTIQVMLRENPFVQKGLSIGQKLMYWATMYSYLAGFAALAYIAAPAIYLIFGIMPVTAYSWDFFGRLIPFLVLNQLMFIIISRGTPTWRGQQYSLALFPVWIRACYTAVLNVVFGRPLGFAVTPKTRQETTAIPWHLVKWQLAAMAMLVVASIIGIVQLYFGAISVLGVGVNLFWVIFDLLILSVVIQAVHFRGHQDQGVR